MQNQQLQFIDKHITNWFQHLDEIIPNLIKNMVTETKENRFDLVTNVDKQIQNDFEAYLEKYFPTHQLLAEEKIMMVLNPIRDTFGLWTLLMEQPI